MCIRDRYNSVNDKDELIIVSKNLENIISTDSLNDIEKVTAKNIREACSHLKPNKTDPTYSFTSDCLKSAPLILFEYLETIIRSFLIHGHVSLVLLLPTLVPIIKDKMGDICSSKNYRSIAISSLLLKIIDWVIILLFGESLKLDDLQFAYQMNCSTTMCSWVVVETVSYFLRNNTEIFSCMTDMTKAFDMVQHSILFKKFISLTVICLPIR